MEQLKTGKTSSYGFAHAEAKNGLFINTVSGYGNQSRLHLKSFRFNTIIVLILQKFLQNCFKNLYLQKLYLAESEGFPLEILGIEFIKDSQDFQKYYFSPKFCISNELESVEFILEIIQFVTSNFSLFLLVFCRHSQGVRLGHDFETRILFCFDPLLVSQVRLIMGFIVQSLDLCSNGGYRLNIPTLLAFFFAVF